jgi:hypothetical protein
MQQRRFADHLLGPVAALEEVAVDAVAAVEADRVQPFNQRMPWSRFANGVSTRRW